MRTSNKILIAVLVFALTSVTVIYGMLRSKYNRGEFITRDAYDAGRSENLSVKPFSSIELINCAGVSMQKSESFFLRVNKNRSMNFTYRVEGSKLIVEGRGDDPGRMVYTPVRIQCPSFSEIILKNAELYLDEYAHTNLTAVLSNESFLQLRNAKIDSLNVFVKESSNLDMGEGVYINLIDLSLSDHSRFTSGSANIGKFRTLSISDSSSIAMDGKNFKGLPDTTRRK